jgi:hypothetical protein
VKKWLNRELPKHFTSSRTMADLSRELSAALITRNFDALYDPQFFLDKLV